MGSSGLRHTLRRCGVRRREFGTFVRGVRVMWEGEVLAPARGEAVKFLETLAAG